MNVTLPPKLEELVRRKIESGLYADPTDVIRDALRLMVRQDEAHERQMDRLRAALDDGERGGFADGDSMARLAEVLDQEAQAEGLPS